MYETMTEHEQKLMNAERVRISETGVDGLVRNRRISGGRLQSVKVLTAGGADWHAPDALEAIA